MRWRKVLWNVWIRTWVLFDTVKTMRNEAPIFLKKAEDYTALFEIKATLIGLESLRGQLLALALSHAEQNSPRKKEVVEAYQKLSAAIAGLDKDFDDYYSDL